MGTCMSLNTRRGQRTTFQDGFPPSIEVLRLDLQWSGYTVCFYIHWAISMALLHFFLKGFWPVHDKLLNIFNNTGETCWLRPWSHCDRHRHLEYYPIDASLILKFRIKKKINLKIEARFYFNSDMHLYLEILLEETDNTIQVILSIYHIVHPVFAWI